MKATRRGDIQSPMVLSDGSAEVELDDDSISSMLGQSALTENADGSAEVDFSPVSASAIADPNTHDANLAEFMSDSALGQLADDIIQKVTDDDESRADWKGQLSEGMRLLGLKMEDRQFPFKGASGAVSPMMLEAIVRTMAEANSELIPPQGPVKTQLFGSTSDERDDKAARVKDFMNLYLTKWAPEYYPDFAQMLFWWGFAGSTFKKVYQDPLKRRPVSPYIRADDFIVSYNTSDLFSCPRMTQRSMMSRRQVRSLQLSGLWLDEPLGDGTVMQDDDIVQMAADSAAGVVKPSYSGDEEYEIYETHLDIDLKDFEHYIEGSNIPSGLPIPYRVSIDKRNNKIFAIRRAWNEGDMSFERDLNFVHYKLIQGPGFYGLGYCHLLGQQTKTSTALIRQAIDTNTLNMFPGGFKAKGMRFEENSLMIGPCQFIELDTGGVPINQAFSAFPYKEFNPATLGLLQYVDEGARNLASTAEVATGEGRQDAPVGTTVALMEAAKKVQSQMIKSGHQALGQELQLFKKQFGLYLPEEPYPFPVRGGMSHIMRADFSDDVDVIPVSDPNITSSAQRLVLAQATLQMATSAPPGTHDLTAAYRQVYEAMGKTADQIQQIMPPPQQAQPLDPLSENMNALMNMPITAGLAQDHDAHIAVHQALQEIPSMQAHMAQHMAMKMRVQVERILGIQLPPPGAQLPPDVENQIAVLTAQAMKQLQDEAGGQEPTAGQIAMEDLRIKAADVAAKVQEAKDKQMLGKYQTDMKMRMNQENLRSKEGIELLRAAANTADNQTPDIPYIKQVLDLGKGGIGG